MEKKTIVRYLLSTLVTFIAGMAMVIAPALNELTLEAVSDGALVGVLFSGARLGTKMVLETFLFWYTAKK